MGGIHDKPPSKQLQALQRAALHNLQSGKVKVHDPAARSSVGTKAPGEHIDQNYLRRRVRLQEGNLDALADRMAKALHELRANLHAGETQHDGESKYQSLVAGLQQPAVKPAPKAQSRPPPAPDASADDMQQVDVKKRLLRALTTRGAFKKLLGGSATDSRDKTGESEIATPVRSTARMRPVRSSAVAQTRVAPPAAPQAAPDRLLEVGGVLRAKVKAQVAQALDDPGVENLSAALQALVLFESPASTRACELRHRLLESALLADPPRPDILYEAIEGFLRYNPPVSGLDYTIVENAPAVYSAFAGQPQRAPLMARFMKQVCDEQFAEDEFLDGDPRIEIVERMETLNRECLAYFADGKRSMRLLMLSATGMTRHLMRQAQALNADYKAWRASPKRSFDS